MHSFSSLLVLLLLSASSFGQSQRGKLRKERAACLDKCDKSAPCDALEKSPRKTSNQCMKVTQDLCGDAESFTCCIEELANGPETACPKSFLANVKLCVECEETCDKKEKVACVKTDGTCLDNCESSAACIAVDTFSKKLDNSCRRLTIGECDPDENFVSCLTSLAKKSDLRGCTKEALENLRSCFECDESCGGSDGPEKTPDMPECRASSPEDMPKAMDPEERESCLNKCDELTECLALETTPPRVRRTCLLETRKECASMGDYGCCIEQISRNPDKYTCPADVLLNLKECVQCGLACPSAARRQNGGRRGKPKDGDGDLDERPRGGRGPGSSKQDIETCLDTCQSNEGCTFMDTVGRKVGTTCLKLVNNCESAEDTLTCLNGLVPDDGSLCTADILSKAISCIACEINCTLTTEVGDLDERPRGRGKGGKGGRRGVPAPAPRRRQEMAICLDTCESNEDCTFMDTVSRKVGTSCLKLVSKCDSLTCLIGLVPDSGSLCTGDILSKAKSCIACEINCTLTTEEFPPKLGTDGLLNLILDAVNGSKFVETQQESGQLDSQCFTSCQEEGFCDRLPKKRLWLKRVPDTCKAMITSSCETMSQEYTQCAFMVTMNNRDECPPRTQKDRKRMENCDRCRKNCKDSSVATFYRTNMINRVMNSLRAVQALETTNSAQACTDGCGMKECNNLPAPKSIFNSLPQDCQDAVQLKCGRPLEGECLHEAMKEAGVIICPKYSSYDQAESCMDCLEECLTFKPDISDLGGPETMSSLIKNLMMLATSRLESAGPGGRVDFNREVVAAIKKILDRRITDMGSETGIVGTTSVPPDMDQKTCLQNCYSPEACTRRVPIIRKQRCRQCLKRACVGEYDWACDAKVLKGECMENCSGVTDSEMLRRRVCNECTMKCMKM